jgi:hypothetical protein
MRLQRLQNLSGIVLEGMPPDEASDDAPHIPAAVAAGMLREGDLSSAEYMRVAFDVPLVPGETQESVSTKDPNALEVCPVVGKATLADILSNGPADGVTPDTVAGHIKALASATRRLNGATKPDGCRGQKAVEQIVKAYLSSIVAILKDSRTLGSLADDCQPNDSGAAPQIEDELAAINSALSTAQASPAFSDEDKKALQDESASLAARSAASDQMIKAAVELAQQGKGPVAVIIGSAHTAKVTKGLKDAGVSYAVIETNAAKSARATGLAMSGSETERRYAIAPALDNPLNRAFDSKAVYRPECPGVASHKYAPIIFADWWKQQKARTYEDISNYAGQVLYGRAPVGSSSGTVATNEAKSFPDAAGQTRSVVFPVSVPPFSGQAQKERVWVVAERGNVFADSGATSAMSDGDVEKELVTAAGDGGDGKPPSAGDRYEASSADKGEGPKRKTMFTEAFVSSDIKIRSFETQSEAIAYASRK